MTKIEAAEKMVSMINEMTPMAKARVWILKDEKDNVTKVRVYLEKGYIDIRDDEKAHIETVGRNFFESAKQALAVTGYKRVYV